jgi:peroxin-3
MTSSSQSTSPTTTTSLRRLIDETSDIIDVKISQLSYKIPPISADSARITEIVGDGVKAKVANSLAVFCRQAHNIGAGANNEYLDKIEQVGELEAFAAVVYSSNFEFESPALAAEGATGVTLAESKDVAELKERGANELKELKEEVKEKLEKAEESFESAWDKAVAK